MFLAQGADALAHGCNCAGSMGKGIAVEFKARWPAMFERYRELCNEGRFKPGDVFPWQEGGVTVFNLGTQKHWRTKASLTAIETALDTMIAMAEERGIETIVLPRIGAGLGKGSWERIKEILIDRGSATAVTLVVCEGFRTGVTPSL